MQTVLLFATKFSKPILQRFRFDRKTFFRNKLFSMRILVSSVKLCNLSIEHYSATIFSHSSLQLKLCTIVQLNSPYCTESLCPVSSSFS